MARPDHTKDTPPCGGRAVIYARAARAQDPQPQPQIAALMAYLNEHGFSNERITVFEEGSAPAAWLLARRSILSDPLAALARENQTPEREPIKAIYVSSERRLFRGANPVDLARFISVCADQGIQILTATAAYDFTDPEQAALFRHRCEQAASNVVAQIGKLKQRGRARGGSTHRPAEE